MEFGDMYNASFTIDRVPAFCPGARRRDAFDLFQRFNRFGVSIVACVPVILVTFLAFLEFRL